MDDLKVARESSLTETDGKLTEQQELFAVEYVENGGHGTQAAVAAGYSAQGASQTASRVLRYPHVAKRIYELSVTSMAKRLPQALAVQEQLLRSSRSDMVKHLVATDMLDRTLGKAVQRVDQHTSAELTVRIDLS